MKTKNKDLIQENKVFVWIAVATGFILSIPLIMSNLSDDWDWSFPDFIAIGILIFGMGSLFIFISRITPRKYRSLIGLGILILLFLAWVHLAVGIVDSWPFAGS